MKISIGSKIVEGPWGGGNLFAINLTNFLSESSIAVYCSSSVVNPLNEASVAIPQFAHW